MALTTRERNKIDHQVEEITRRRCSGMAINVLDIGKVFQEAYIAASGVTGEDVESAVVRTYHMLSAKTAGGPQ